jgi:hypothetical protein
MAIAGSVLHELATHTLPLAFFATHYGSLTDDFAHVPMIRNMHMSTMVDDEKREVRILYPKCIAYQLTCYSWSSCTNLFKELLSPPSAHTSLGLQAFLNLLSSAPTLYQPISSASSPNEWLDGRRPLPRVCRPPPRQTLRICGVWPMANRKCLRTSSGRKKFWRGSSEPCAACYSSNQITYTSSSLYLVHAPCRSLAVHSQIAYSSTYCNT